MAKRKWLQVLFMHKGILTLRVEMVHNCHISAQHLSRSVVRAWHVQALDLTSGTPIWDDYFGSLTTSYEAVSIGVDQNGAVYAVATSGGSGEDYDFYLMKYDIDGNTD